MSNLKHFCGITRLTSAEHRIQEAGERLLDSRYTKDTILNIALDVGFRFLSSFNKAFRERFNQTPTEYRAQLQENQTN